MDFGILSCRSVGEVPILVNPSDVLHIYMPMVNNVFKISAAAMSYMSLQYLLRTLTLLKSQYKSRLLFFFMKHVIESPYLLFGIL